MTEGAKINKITSKQPRLGGIGCPELYKSLRDRSHITYTQKMYLSHSGKWMQVAFSLSHSSTFTCTTPVKPYKFPAFPGLVQVNVLE